MDYSHFLTPALGIGGLVVLAVLMLLRGDIVPRKQVDTLLAVKDEQIAFYKGAYEDLLTARRTQERQITALMETAQTTRHVLAALPEVVRHTEGSGNAPAQAAD
jgi:hypothetical protein